MKEYLTKIKFGLAMWGIYALIVATPSILSKVFFSGQMWGGPAFFIGLFLIPLILFGMPFIAGVFASKYFRDNKGGWKEGLNLGIYWFIIGLLFGFVIFWWLTANGRPNDLTPLFFVIYFMTINLAVLFVVIAVGSKHTSSINQVPSTLSDRLSKSSKNLEPKKIKKHFVFKRIFLLIVVSVGIIIITYSFSYIKSYLGSSQKIEKIYETIENNEAFIGCGCSDLKPANYLERCLYRAKGESLEEWVKADKKRSEKGLCNNECILPTVFRYCD